MALIILDSGRNVKTLHPKPVFCTAAVVLKIADCTVLRHVSEILMATNAVACP